MMTARLIDALATTDALADVFSDTAVLQAMLDFEAALARAAADAGAIPAQAAAVIGEAARAADFDAAAIARAARASGTAAIPLVQALTERVRAVDAGSASFVHWAATSQDVTDSALLLLLRRARTLVAADHRRLATRLRELSAAHAATVMLGRTLLQPAPPITFGLKVAQWYAAAERAWARLEIAEDEAMVVQFGGATGTRAAAGAFGEEVGRRLAEALGLRPSPPWHTDRDRLGAVVAACGLYTAALGKIARDIALLMQAEIAEVAGPGGGSSSMPHKRNPSGCAIAIAAATRTPGLVAAFFGGMIQEHERSAGAGHAEWPTVADVVQTTGAAAAAMASVAEELTVDTARMRANLDATRGVVFAERAVSLLTRVLGKEEARRHVMRAVQRTRETGDAFPQTLASMPEVAGALPASDLEGISSPDAYLGDAEALRMQLLGQSRDAQRR